MKTFSAIFILLLISFVSVAQIDTTFWFVVPEITENHADRPVNLVISSSQDQTPTNVTISMPKEPAFDPISFTANGYETNVIDLTERINLIESASYGIVDKMGILIRADAPVSAYYEVAPLQNREIYSLKGSNALGYEFFCPVQNEYNNHTNIYWTYPARNRIDVVAAEDNTVITIKITAAANGLPAGSTITTPVMHTGETFSVVADNEASGNHLGGTKITSNNKRIAVTLTDDSVEDPTGGHWDLLGDQLVPVQTSTGGAEYTIGFDYIVTKTRLTIDEQYFILATEDLTNIQVDGVNIGNIDAGETQPVIISGDIDYISCDKRVYLYHVGGFEGEMGGAMIPSVDGCKGTSRISFPRTWDFAFHINLLVKGDAHNAFYMEYEDGTTYQIPPGNFTLVPNTPDGETWYYLNRDANGFTDGQSPGVPVGQITSIYNTESIFQMGLYNGTPVYGCTYGYFSDFKNKTWNQPVLAKDTIFTANADTLVLDAGADFISYEWQDGSTDRTYTVTSDVSQMYYVTVQHINSCAPITDSVFVSTDDIQPTAVLAPNSACELSSTETFSVQLQNNSGNTISTGEEIDFGIQINGEQPITETYTVTTDIDPNSSSTIDLTTEFNFGQIGTYEITLWCNQPVDNNRTNDTISLTREVFGYPDFAINYDTVFTTNSDTVELIVTPHTYESYLWNVNVDNDTLPLAGYNKSFYKVKVTDENGCASYDSVSMVSKNLSVHKITEPYDACEHTSEELITIRLKNTGNEIIEAGALINLSLAGSFSISEQTTLPNDLLPQDSVDCTFTTPVDLSAVSVYTFTISINADFDVSTGDDHLSANVETYGPAIIDLGEEITINAVPYALTAGEEFVSYLWHDGSTNQEFTINETNISPTGLYEVTVTNTNGCEGSDSKLVNVDIIDWNVDEMLAPADDCFNEFDDQLSVQISNQSGVPVKQGRTFNIGYQINDNSLVEEIFTLTDSLYPEATYTHTFSYVSGFEPLTNNISIKMDTTGDINQPNNTISRTVSLHSPFVNFDYDTVIPEAFPYNLIAPNGFAAYEWSTGESGQTLVVNTSDTFILTAFDSYGCSGSDTIFVENPVGIFPNGINQGKMKVWPNPARNKLSITINRKTNGRCTLEILSSTGKIVWKQKMESTEAVKTIPVSNFANGMYFVRVYDNDEYIIESVIIKK